jgi:hypothetical protein
MGQFVMLSQLALAEEPWSSDQSAQPAWVGPTWCTNGRRVQAATVAKVTAHLDNGMPSFSLNLDMEHVRGRIRWHFDHDVPP